MAGNAAANAYESSEGDDEGGDGGDDEGDDGTVLAMPCKNAAAATLGLLSWLPAGANGGLRNVRVPGAPCL